MEEDHCRFVIPAVIHDGVMNASKCRSRIEGRIFDVERLHQINYDIGPVLRILFLHSLCFRHCVSPLSRFLNRYCPRSRGLTAVVNADVWDLLSSVPQLSSAMVRVMPARPLVSSLALMSPLSYRGAIPFGRR